jgi:hypothetical protein
MGAMATMRAMVVGLTVFGLAMTCRGANKPVALQITTSIKGNGKWHQTWTGKWRPPYVVSFRTETKEADRIAMDLSGKTDAARLDGLKLRRIPNWFSNATTGYEVVVKHPNDLQEVLNVIERWRVDPTPARWPVRAGNR